MSYVSRRERLLEQCGAGPVLLCGAGPENGNASFFYLTGLYEPQGVLLLSKEKFRMPAGRANPGPDYVRGRSARQVLFLPRRDPLRARWGEDSAATVESVDADEHGYDAVLPLSALPSVLPPLLRQSDGLHFVRAAHATLDGEEDADTVLVNRIRRRFFHLSLHDAGGHVDAMRAAKDGGEIEALRRSIDVTREALTAALTALVPGNRERHMEAEIARVYRSHGGTHSFDPIVGAGGNALLLHYGENSGPIDDGALVLVDTGVRLDGYCSDITRTFPASGKFSDRQRELYDIVLLAQQAAIEVCRPGGLVGDAHARAWAVIHAAGYAEFFPHGTSHHLGLETHDVGDVHAPLVAGAVVTVEPGIYLPDENLGIRIEDDVLVTENGPEILSKAIPKTADDVEAWIAEARR